jgi:hypothetical protein
LLAASPAPTWTYPHRGNSARSDDPHWHGSGRRPKPLPASPCSAGAPHPLPAPPTPLSKRTCGALTNAKSARRATSSSPSPSMHQGWGAGTATHDAGGLPHGSSYFLGRPWLRPRDPKEAQGAAQQRRCPVKYKPPPHLLRCARGGGRAPPRTTRAAFRTGVPTQ